MSVCYRCNRTGKSSFSLYTLTSAFSLTLSSAHEIMLLGKGGRSSAWAWAYTTGHGVDRERVCSVVGGTGESRFGTPLALVLWFWSFFALPWSNMLSTLLILLCHLWSFRWNMWRVGIEYCSRLLYFRSSLFRGVGLLLRNTRILDSRLLATNNIEIEAHSAPTIWRCRLGRLISRITMKRDRWRWMITHTFDIMI